VTKPGFSYRRARDWVYGIVRKGGRVTGYAPTGANIREKALLLALVEFAPNIEPSTEALARMLELGTPESPDEKAVRRLLQSCEAKGLLRIEHRKGRRSIYSLSFDPGHSAPRQADDEPRAQCPPTPGEVPPQPRAPRPLKQTSKADNKADKDLEPLRLELVAGRDEPKPKGTKPLAQPSEHKRVTEHYFAEFRRQRGVDPVFRGAEGKAVQRLVEALGAARACEAITTAFKSFRAGNVTILQIAKDPLGFEPLHGRAPVGGRAGDLADGLALRAQRAREDERRALP
jgi:hypothetical protein